MPTAFTLISSHVVDQHPIVTTDDEPTDDIDLVALDVDLVTPDVVMDIPLRRLERVHSSAISDDYIIYLQEHEYDVG